MANQNFCEDLQLTTAINAVAVLIASQFQSADEQVAAAAILTQIADTIAVIAAKNTLCNKKSE